MSQVHVVLIDGATGAPLAEVDLPAAQLPETFAVPTTMHLGDSDWRVESADPVTRAEYAARGQLRLVLRQVAAVAPESILFSLPTIENVAPPLDDAAAGALHLHEDHWRQCELVAARFAAEIAEELAAIRAIRDAQRHGPGYRNLHVRSRIAAPLAVPAAELAALGAPRALTIGPHGAPRAGVAGGRAVERPGGLLYWREDAGTAVALGVLQSDPDLVPLVALAAPLAALAHAHDLLLLDWCRAAQLRSDGARFVLTSR